MDNCRLYDFVEVSFRNTFVSKTTTPNFIHMELKEIKALLSMATVLGHYGLKPDKHDRLHCPFHPDKTPSLQIYPKTNTYCCFSSNCTAGTGDTIQFIQLMEKCNKHEALVKAASLVGANAHPSSAVPAPGAKLVTEADELQTPMKLTTSRRFKLTRLRRSKLTT